MRQESPLNVITAIDVKVVDSKRQSHTHLYKTNSSKDVNEYDLFIYKPEFNTGNDLAESST